MNSKSVCLELEENRRRLSSDGGVDEEGLANGGFAAVGWGLEERGEWGSG